MMDTPLDELYWRDELLQIIYWFRGEGLGQTITAQDLLPFLNGTEELIQQHLDRLAHDGYLTLLEGARYQLTEWGVKEAGRRFADEFSGLTGQGHGECNNPNCSCLTDGPSACVSH